MKESAKQWTIAAFIACVFVGLEWLTESTLANTFVKDNGLMLIMALIAINVATLAALVSIMLNLEQQHNRPYFFDASKKMALTGISEMLILGFIFFFFSAIVPERYWVLNYTNCQRWEGVIITVTAIISRMCLFQSVYATYDFSKSIIKLTTLPDGVELSVDIEKETHQQTDD